jgi:hypothetical protein
MEKYFSFLLKKASRISAFLPAPALLSPIPNIFYSLLLNHIIQFIETTNSTRNKRVCASIKSEKGHRKAAEKT